MGFVMTINKINVPVTGSSRRVWLVWAVGLTAYTVGVMHRTSFGVAGLDAADRFDASPAVLSGFVVLQLLVYAVLQIPVGMLLDRFGARRLVVVGALTMAAGQLLLAVAETDPARGGRPGAGRGGRCADLHQRALGGHRLVPGPPGAVDDPADRAARPARAGAVGGAVRRAAARPGLDHRLRLRRPRLGVAVALAVLAVVRDRPAGRPAAATRSVAPAGAGRAGRRPGGSPGTRLGLWTHMGTQFSGTVFALLWGVPYLVAGQGLSAGAASALLTLFVLVGIVAGPMFGVFTARHPLRRSWLVLSVILLTAGAWTVGAGRARRPRRSGCWSC